MWSFWAMTECEKDALHVLMHRVGLPEAERKPQLADEAARRLAAPLKVIDDHLATREWLAGERFTVADICAASVLAWVRVAKALPPERPQLARWLQACVSRPSFVRARSVGTQAAQPAS
jgi:glutathione S-transferase